MAKKVIKDKNLERKSVGNHKRGHEWNHSPLWTATRTLHLFVQFMGRIRLWSLLTRMTEEPFRLLQMACWQHTRFLLCKPPVKDYASLSAICGITFTALIAGYFSGARAWLRVAYTPFHLVIRLKEDGFRSRDYSAPSTNYTLLVGSINS